MTELPYIVGFQKSQTNLKGIDLSEWKYVFKFDIAENGSKETVGVNNYQLFLENIYSINSKNFYQVIRENRLIREYYDIDIPGDFCEENWDNETVKFVNDFIYHRNEFGKDLDGDKFNTLNKTDFIILTAHKKTKLSFHIYSKKTAFKNIETHNNFASHLKCRIPKIDLSVYSKNRAIRLVGNSKLGEDRPLKPFGSNAVSVSDTLIELSENAKGYNIIKFSEKAKVKHPETEPLDEDLEEQEWFQEFLEDNPEYTFHSIERKLRRDGNYERTPCLVEPSATHGTDSYFINKYKGVYFVCCPQHKGKYTIPNQPIVKEKIPQNLETIKWLCSNKTQKNVADALIPFLKNDLFHTDTHGWIYWENQAWRIDCKPESLVKSIVDILEPTINEFQEWILLQPDTDQKKLFLKNLAQLVNNLGNFTFMNNVLKILTSSKALRNIEIANKFESNPNLFAFKNGVVDLYEEGRFRPINRDDYIIVNCGYDRTEQREEKRFVLDFLMNIFGSEELVNTFISACSLYLHGENINEVFLIWTGEGGNGKGVLDTLLQVVFGDYYKTISSSQLTNPMKSAGGHNSELMTTIYARCVMTSEVGDGETNEKLKIANIKKWTGRDPLSCRDLHKTSITFKPRFTLTMQCNDIPNLSKKDGGIERRLKIIPFPISFVENKGQSLGENERYRDETLKHKIQTEPKYRNGFIQLLIDSWVKNKGKFVACKEVENTTKKFIDDQNPIKEWLFNRYEEDQECQGFTACELFEIYVQELKEEAKVKNKDAMAKNLNGLGIKPHHTNKNNYYRLKRKPEIKIYNNPLDD